jgi:hypothetical protein
MKNAIFLTLCVSALIDLTLGSSTVVSLCDADLQQLLQIVFSQLNGSTFIPITLLQELGLNTASVITLLQNLGYTILW